jgi:hypothetical protein
MHGGAQGADDCADEWGRIPWLNVEILRFRANWHDEGLAAGPIRNARMLADGKPDRGIAFGALWRFDHLKTKKWKRTGTGDMVARMLAARLPVRWIATPEALAIDLVQMPEAPRNSKAFFL